MEGQCWLNYFGHLIPRLTHRKDLMLGKDEAMRMREDEMGGWYPQINGHEMSSSQEILNGQIDGRESHNVGVQA